MFVVLFCYQATFTGNAGIIKTTAPQSLLQPTELRQSLDLKLEAGKLADLNMRPELDSFPFYWPFLRLLRSTCIHAGNCQAWIRKTNQILLMCSIA